MRALLSTYSPFRRWRLRSALLAPILLLAPLPLAATWVAWEAAARREADSLVAQRQATALAGLNARVMERRQANELMGYLVGQRGTLSEASERGNTLRLAQILVPCSATTDS